MGELKYEKKKAVTWTLYLTRLRWLWHMKLFYLIVSQCRDSFAKNILCLLIFLTMQDFYVILFTWQHCLYYLNISSTTDEKCLCWRHTAALRVTASVFPARSLTASRSGTLLPLWGPELLSSWTLLTSHHPRCGSAEMLWREELKCL